MIDYEYYVPAWRKISFHCSGTLLTSNPLSGSNPIWWWCWKFVGAPIATTAAGVSFFLRRTNENADRAKPATPPPTFWNRFGPCFSSTAIAAYHIISHTSQNIVKCRHIRAGRLGYDTAPPPPCNALICAWISATFSVLPSFSAAAFWPNNALIYYHMPMSPS